MASAICVAERVFVPLFRRLAVNEATPGKSVGSFSAPAVINKRRETTGCSWDSSAYTVSPFGRTRFSYAGNSIFPRGFASGGSCLSAVVAQETRSKYKEQNPKFFILDSYSPFPRGGVTRMTHRLSRLKYL